MRGTGARRRRRRARGGARAAVHPARASRSRPGSAELGGDPGRRRRCGSSRTPTGPTLLATLCATRRRDIDRGSHGPRAAPGRRRAARGRPRPPPLRIAGRAAAGAPRADPGRGRPADGGARRAAAAPSRRRHRRVRRRAPRAPARCRRPLRPGDPDHRPTRPTSAAARPRSCASPTGWRGRRERPRADPHRAACSAAGAPEVEPELAAARESWAERRRGSRRGQAARTAGAACSGDAIVVVVRRSADRGRDRAGDAAPELEARMAAAAARAVRLGAAVRGAETCPSAPDFVTRICDGPGARRVPATPSGRLHMSVFRLFKRVSFVRIRLRRQRHHSSRGPRGRSQEARHVHRLHRPSRAPPSRLRGRRQLRRRSAPGALRPHHRHASRPTPG